MAISKALFIGSILIFNNQIETNYRGLHLVT
jgi:hypothetical protein